MIVEQYDNTLGFSLNPIKAIKKVGGGIATGARKVGSGVATGARYTGRGIKTGVKYAGKGLEYTLLKPAEWIGSKLTAPVRSRVATIRNRRAAKLAWDRRKSKTPNAAEQAEAKAWTKSHLAAKGPHGKILSYFAGAPDYLLLGYFDNPNDGDLGVAPAVVAAMIPVLVALATSLIQQFAKSGEAPVDPARGAGPDPSIPPDAEAQAAAEAAAAQAAEGVQDAVEDAGVESGSGQMVRLPGGGKVQRGNLLLFGGLGLAVVVAIVLMKRKS